MNLTDINVQNLGEARAANIATQRIAAASGGYIPGICRFCGCTERMPCTLEFNPPTYCAWFDSEQTVCTAVACVDALYQEEEQGGAL